MLPTLTADMNSYEVLSEPWVYIAHRSQYPPPHIHPPAPPLLCLRWNGEGGHLLFDPVQAWSISSFQVFQEAVCWSWTPVVVKWIRDTQTHALWPRGRGALLCVCVCVFIGGPEVSLETWALSSCLWTERDALPGSFTKLVLTLAQRNKTDSS